MRHWVQKFRCAFRGIAVGMAGQSSFLVHVPATLLVAVMAVALRCSAVQCCILALCVALVWVAELMNSAVELLARGLCMERNVEVGKALDTASGAVLLASIFAAGIGGSVFVARLLQMFEG